jgi:endonuclease YncB( thermonuclease family)
MMLARVAVLFVTFIVAGAALAGDLLGPVTRVRDGDTIEVAGVPVRLQGLHCPEIGETGGRQARDFMVQLVKGREVRCALTGERTFDREVGRCYLTDAGERYDIAALVIAEGYGRDCPRYSGGRYAASERRAPKRWPMPLPGYCGLKEISSQREQ